MPIPKEAASAKTSLLFLFSCLRLTITSFFSTDESIRLACSSIELLSFLVSKAYLTLFTTEFNLPIAVSESSKGSLLSSMESNTDSNYLSSYFVSTKLLATLFFTCSSSIELSKL
tara:strand:- start:237 stop:581 length:345 start_codon:yes stop_codon:yes gene_type:complete